MAYPISELLQRMPFDRGWQRALFLGCALILFGPFVLLGPASYIEAHDNMNVAFPFYLAMGLKDFFAKWYPFQMGGVDRWSQSVNIGYQIVAFHLVPAWIAYQVLVIGHAAVAGWAATRIAHRWMKFSRDLSWWSGLTYAASVASAGMVVVMPAVWPIAAAVVQGDRTRDASIGRRVLLAALLGVGAGILASPLSVVAFDWLAFPIILLLRDGRLSLSLILESGVFCAAYGAGTAPELLVMASAAAGSQRAPFTYGWEFVRALLSINAYGLLIVVSAGSLWFWRELNPSRRAAVVGLLAALLLLCVWYLLYDRYADFLPGLITRVNFKRLLNPLALLTILAMGVGIQLWADRAPRWRTVFLTAVPAVLLISGGLGYERAGRWVQYGNAMQLQIPQVQALAQEQGGRLGEFRVEVVNYPLGGGFFNTYGLESAGGYLNLFPERYKNLYLLAATPKSPDIQRPDVVKAFERTNQLDLSCTETSQGYLLAERCFDVGLLGLLNVKYLIGRNPLRGEGLSLVSGPATPFNLLSQSQKIWQAVKENFGGAFHLFIFRIDNVVPRSFLAQSVSVVDGWDSLKSALKADPIAKTIATPSFLTSDLPLDLTARASSLGGGGEARIMRFEPDVVEIGTRAVRDTMLIVTNSYSPLWSVTVNGKPAALVPAYGALWGVPIPGGASKVRFTYK